MKRKIRTRIVIVEGEHADHLTTTTALQSPLFVVLVLLSFYDPSVSTVSLQLSLSLSNIFGGLREKKKLFKTFCFNLTK